MSAPSKVVRGQTLLRDGFRCLKCGRRDTLEWQHREASGQGGRGPKAPVPISADGVILCTVHNAEAESSGQDQALALGWKIRRNRGAMLAAEIPFFDCNDRTWYLPGVGSSRSPIHFALALDLLDVAGNLRRKKALR